MDGGRKTEDRMRFGDEFPAAGICAAFRLCFDVDFDVDYLLFCYMYIIHDCRLGVK